MRIMLLGKVNIMSFHSYYLMKNISQQEKVHLPLSILRLSLFHQFTRLWNGWDLRRATFWSLPAASVILSVCCPNQCRTAVFTVWRLTKSPQALHSSSTSVLLLQDNRLSRQKFPTAFLTQLLVMFRLVISALQINAMIKTIS